MVDIDTVIVTTTVTAIGSCTAKTAADDIATAAATAAATTAATAAANASTSATTSAINITGATATTSEVAAASAAAFVPYAFLLSNLAASISISSRTFRLTVSVVEYLFPLKADAVADIHPSRVEGSDQISSLTAAVIFVAAALL
jgi:hypothetical protein